ncbi:MAG: class I tRNA ligase family protein, partial [Candidatus ainarchaeum sp.]|nr:class I tRNA ligase family protein [Candidatus ainarchaeum sp.]
DLRTYLLLQSKGSDFKFDINGVAEMRNFFNTFSNALNYVNLYTKIDFSEKNLGDLLPEDNWILSKLSNLNNNVLNSFNNYEFYKSVSLIMDFVDKDFSRTYLQLIRKRINEEQVSKTISIIVDSLLKLIAPITPHAADYYYTFFNKGVSVHTLNFNDLSFFLNNDLENEFCLVEEISRVSLAIRSQEKLRLRWVLEELVIVTNEKINNFEKVIGTMVNVKNVVLKKSFEKNDEYIFKEFSKGKIFLKTSASKELKDLWEISELLRQIQDARKKAGLKPGQKTELQINSNDKTFLEKNKKMIEDKTSTTIKIVDLKEMQKFVEREFSFKIII